MDIGKIKENWQQLFMALASLGMAVVAFPKGKIISFGVIPFLLMVFAVVASVLKSKYVQYSYYILSFLWFMSLAYAVYLAYTSVGLVIVSATVAVLPVLLMPVLTALLLGLMSRKFFDKPIQQAKIIVDTVIALIIACLILLLFWSISFLKPDILEFAKSFQANKLTIYSLLIVDGLVWVLIAQALPMLVMTSFIKNWSKWQALLTAFFVSLTVFSLMIEGQDSFLMLSSVKAKIYLVEFFASVLLLFSTYFVARKFVNNRFSIAFD